MPAFDDPQPYREIGEETEGDAPATPLSKMRETNIAGSDWTTETIVSQLRKGNIDLNPQLQRRAVWDSQRKSRLIESIILNLPIPQIVLAERQEQNNTYIVLDGKQRLLAIREFCADPKNPQDRAFKPLHLSKLNVLPELQGKTYSGLDSVSGPLDMLNAFDNSTIRTVVIRNWPEESFLFRVFRRLNTGGVRLSSQELRQSLAPGPFTDYMDEFTRDSRPLQQALGLSKPDFRMRDNEIFLRYMAFATNANSYGGNLKRFLDEAAKNLNKQWTDNAEALRKESEVCNQAIQATLDIFGLRDAFSTYNVEKKTFSRPFNRAVFDIMTYFFRSARIRQAAIAHPDRVKEGFISLSEQDYEFVQSLTATTKSKTATARRFVRWSKELSAAIALPVQAPTPFIHIESGD